MNGLGRNFFYSKMTAKYLPMWRKNKSLSQKIGQQKMTVILMYNILIISNLIH